MGKSKTSDEIKAIYKSAYKENFRPKKVKVNGHEIDVDVYLANPAKYNKLPLTKEAKKEIEKMFLD